MKSIVLHSKLTINGREFHFHTGTIFDKNIIQSEIFESGRFVTSAQQSFQLRKEADYNARDDYINLIASELHQDTMEEVQKLFTIESKIKPLRLPVPHYKLGLLFYDKNLLDEAKLNFQTAINLKSDFSVFNKQFNISI